MNLSWWLNSKILRQYISERTRPGALVCRKTTHFSVAIMPNYWGKSTDLLETHIVPLIGRDKDDNLAEESILSVYCRLAIIGPTEVVKTQLI